VFGARGSANFLSRATAALATLFFAVSLSLAYLVSGVRTGGGEQDSVTERLQAPGAELLEEQAGEEDDADGSAIPAVPE
jgi:preprotein translocase subunit SecG